MIMSQTSPKVRTSNTRRFRLVVPEDPQIRRPRISERWTITELISFPSLLEYFGSDWKSIAATMKTETAQMVSYVDHLLLKIFTDYLQGHEPLQ
jgi:hypothetical protein